MEKQELKDKARECCRDSSWHRLTAIEMLVDQTAVDRREAEELIEQCFDEMAEG